MEGRDYAEAIRLLPQNWSSERNGYFSIGATRYSVIMCLATLGFMYSVHNLIAPNMTAIAKLFHFNRYERDEYIGGELTLFFYLPGVFSSLLSGLLCGIVCRRTMLAALAVLTAISCLSTAWVQSFHQLAWSRAITGAGIGGALPVIYSMVGDWFPAKNRTSATAFVAASTGAGVFFGQCVATLTGASDWRWPFVLVAIPCGCFAALIEYTTEEPNRGAQEDSIEALYQHTGVHYRPTFSMRHFHAALENRTNLLVTLQAFPGNIPWGVIMVYLHDFLIQDLGMSPQRSLLAITILAASAFCGVLFGGFIGEKLYARGTWDLVGFCGTCNIVRAIPFYFLFGWNRLFGDLATGSAMAHLAFFTLLIVAGLAATVASAGTGAMLLNVNLPETRGSVVALYAVLDDVSKGLGALFISFIAPLVGGRAVAYQFSLLFWVLCGAALLLTWVTYDEDERKMKEHLEEVAMECMVRVSKQNARQAIRRCAKAAGEAHFKESYVLRKEPSRLRWGAGV